MDKKDDPVDTDEKRTLRILLDLLSHDINNHIYGSMGYLELLETMMEENPTLKRFLRNSMSELKSISHLVDNVRLLVNIENEPFQGEEVDLKGQLNKAREVAAYQIEYKKLDLKIEMDEDISVRADRFLQDAFVQLLTNSLKNDDSEEVQVHVGCKVDGEGNALISFEDQGKGIPDEMKEKIFDRFRRSIEEGDVHGKGMGLSVVKEVLDRYGGTVSIEDRIRGDHSKGARFLLTIPLS